MYQPRFSAKLGKPKYDETSTPTGFENKTAPKKSSWVDQYSEEQKDREARGYYDPRDSRGGRGYAALDGKYVGGKYNNSSYKEKVYRNQD